MEIKKIKRYWKNVCEKLQTKLLKLSNYVIKVDIKHGWPLGKSLAGMYVGMGI